MGGLASLVPRHERPIVRAHAARLRRTARERQWPGSRPDQLCRHVCFVVAAIAPTLPPAALSLLARYALWSFVLDDALDASGADPAALARICDAVSADPDRPVIAGDPVSSALAGMRDELSQYDRSGELVDRFGEALLDAVRAGVEQVLLGRAVAAGISPPPTAEQYLALGARSANYRSFAVLLAAVAARGMSGATLDRMEPALDHAARAVRLANDLPSLARDQAESGLNITRLRTADGRPVTESWVLAEADRCVRAHDGALATVDGAGPAVPALRRSLRVTVELFRAGGVR